MANQRPIRRGRIPFRRFRRKRPQRWLDANSATTGELGNCIIGFIPVSCDRAAVHELLRGETDTDWSDKNAVTVDRILGTVSLGFTFIIGPDPEFQQKVGPVVIYRLAALNIEEVDDPTTLDFDLFDNESREKKQWMWLHQGSFAFDERLDVPADFADGYNYTVPTAIDVPVDIKTRRALSKDDSIVLMLQWKTTYPLQSEDTTIPGYESVSMIAVPQLRSIVQS